MSFQFIENPTGPALSDQDYLRSSLEQPMALIPTLGSQVKGGVLESFGLGTVIRQAELPSRLTGPELTFESPALNRAAQEKYAGKITEDQYKTSPYFRDGIPWEDGMTRDRAAALADQYDARKVREFYASKRPITSFFGKLIGTATDPINYIPIFGEGVAAANTARFGRVAGQAITSSAEAAANTAIASVATIPARRELGDDVSFQSTVSQVAMAALIGGAFGALHGRFLARDPELLAEAEAKLSTLKNVQKSRVALNDAIDGMMRDGEVKLSPASADFVAQAADAELPKVVIARMARQASPDAFQRLDELNRTFDINQAEIVRLQGVTMDNEAFGPTRRAMIEADQMNERLQDAEQQVKAAKSKKAKDIASTRRDEIRQQLKDHLATIDDEKVRQIEEADDMLASRRQANVPVAEERARLQDYTRQVTADATRRYWQDATQQFRERAGPRETDPGFAPRAAVDTTVPKPEPVPEAMEAAKRVGKPEASHDLAEQYRVDPETGDFPEMADIEQLRQSGRLTDDDIAELDAAEETMKQAKGFGEAVKAFSRCII